MWELIGTAVGWLFWVLVFGFWSYRSRVDFQLRWLRTDVERLEREIERLRARSYAA